MINAILPLTRKKIITNVSRDLIVHNFNREVETAYWIFSANQNDKDYYGSFLGDEIIIKKKSLLQQLFPTLVCKLEYRPNEIIANLKIGYPYWLMVNVIFLISLFSLTSIYMSLFAAAVLLIRFIKDYSGFCRDAASLLENVILVDDGLPRN